MVEIFAETDEGLDDVGRVIDFSVLKSTVGAWIDEEWDHTTIVFEDDHETIEGLDIIPRFKPYFIAPWNPTAENMAHYLLNAVCPEVLAGTGVRVVKVIVHETPNCSAEAEIY